MFLFDGVHFHTLFFTCFFPFVRMATCICFLLMSLMNDCKHHRGMSYIYIYIYTVHSRRIPPDTGIGVSYTYIGSAPHVPGHCLFALPLHRTVRTIHVAYHYIYIYIYDSYPVHTYVFKHGQSDLAPDCELGATGSGTLLAHTWCIPFEVQRSPELVWECGGLVEEHRGGRDEEWRSKSYKKTI